MRRASGLEFASMDLVMPTDASRSGAGRYKGEGNMVMGKIARAVLGAVRRRLRGDSSRNTNGT